jgi:hypothetical protein
MKNDPIIQHLHPKSSKPIALQVPRLSTTCRAIQLEEKADLRDDIYVKWPIQPIHALINVRTTP